MTVKELKQALEQYPDHMDVFMDERMTEFRYGLVNSVTSSEVNFSEDVDSEALATDMVVILSED